MAKLMLSVPFFMKVNELNSVGKMAKPSIALTKIWLLGLYLLQLRVAHESHVFQVQQEVDIVLDQVAQTFCVVLRSRFSGPYMASMSLLSMRNQLSRAKQTRYTKYLTNG